MNNNSSDYTQSILNLSLILKTRMVQNAVSSAAENGTFSILDVYRELGYRPTHSHEWYNKSNDFQPNLIQKTMRKMGVQVEKRSGRACVRKYYLSAEKGGRV